MNQMVAIGAQAVAAKEYNGQRVVTFKDIDRLHERKDGTARRNFKTNRKHFEEGKDFFKVTQLDEIRPLGISSNFGAILVTESGYLMLAKSFTDDKAWQVQRSLVDCYFHRNQPAPEPPKQIEPPYQYTPKFWRGRQVVTILDIVRATGITRGSIQSLLTNHAKELRKDEAMLLTGDAITAFRRENPKAINDHASELWIITERGFNKLAKWRKGETTALTLWQKKPLPTLPTTPEAPNTLSLAYEAFGDKPSAVPTTPGTPTAALTSDDVVKIARATRAEQQRSDSVTDKIRRAIIAMEVALEVYDQWDIPQYKADGRSMVNQLGVHIVRLACGLPA